MDGESTETGAGIGGGGLPQCDGPERKEKGDCETVQCHVECHQVQAGQRRSQRGNIRVQGVEAA